MHELPSVDTLPALLTRSQRRSGVPVRRSFLQQGDRSAPRPGPLADFVRRHDVLGLHLLLLVHAVASAPPWNVVEPATIWARALGLREGRSAGSTISKTWRRLEERRLIARKRLGRYLSTLLLKEDGSGERYEHPFSRREPYFQIPLEYWLAPEAWHRSLSLPETATLLIGLSLRDNFILPPGRAKRWYGLSADTVEDGLRGLVSRGVLVGQPERRPAPAAPLGVVIQQRYTFRPPFGPRQDRGAGVASAAEAPPGRGPPPSADDNEEGGHPAPTGHPPRWATLMRSSPATLELYLVGLIASSVRARDAARLISSSAW